MKKLNNRGIAHLVIILAVVVVAAIGLVGYIVVNNNHDQAGTVSATDGIPTTIKTKADLNQASKALDETSIDDSLNPNQLDADLNALL